MRATMNVIIIKKLEKMINYGTFFRLKIILSCCYNNNLSTVQLLEYYELYFNIFYKSFLCVQKLINLNFFKHD